MCFVQTATQPYVKPQFQVGQQACTGSVVINTVAACQVPLPKCGFQVFDNATNSMVQFDASALSTYVLTCIVLALSLGLTVAFRISAPEYEWHDVDQNGTITSRYLAKVCGFVSDVACSHENGMACKFSPQGVLDGSGVWSRFMAQPAPTFSLLGTLYPGKIRFKGAHLAMLCSNLDFANPSKGFSMVTTNGQKCASGVRTFNFTFLCTPVNVAGCFC